MQTNPKRHLLREPDKHKGHRVGLQPCGILKSQSCRDGKQISGWLGASLAKGPEGTL